MTTIHDALRRDLEQIAYRTGSLAAGAKRLAALGCPRYATAGTTPLLNRGPAGTLIEPCGLRSPPEDTAVIDAGNYIPALRDRRIDAIDPGLAKSQ